MDKRRFKKLRISVTNSCNMACKYCVPENHTSELRKFLNPVLSVSDTIEIVKKLHSDLLLEKVRITGGEPLLQPNIATLIREIKLLGIEDIGLTTNAFYLKKLAPKLKDAGLKSVNISLDAIDRDVFLKMTRKNFLDNTLQGIYAAMECGLDVKLNSVILKEINDNQIIPLLQFGIKHGIPVRFMELMKMGYLHHNYEEYFLSQNEMLDIIKNQYSIHKKIRIVSSTANYWEIDKLDYSFGIIANETEPFCSDCDRLRLDSSGKIYGCISATQGISIMKKIKSGMPIKAELDQALKQKQADRFIGNEMSMINIGG